MFIWSKLSLKGYLEVINVYKSEVELIALFSKQAFSHVATWSVIDKSSPFQCTLFHHYTIVIIIIIYVQAVIFKPVNT